jgi:hypothetical protein
VVCGGWVPGGWWVVRGASECVKNVGSGQKGIERANDDKKVIEFERKSVASQIDHSLYTIRRLSSLSFSSLSSSPLTVSRRSTSDAGRFPHVHPFETTPPVARSPPSTRRRLKRLPLD